MSTVPSGTRFIGIAENVNLTERKSAVLNSDTQAYTIQDLADTFGGVTKVLKTTITSAQVLQLFTTPITILNSDNPLTVAYPISIYIKRNVGTAYGLSTNTIQIINDFGTALSTNINSNPLGQTEGFTQAAISANQNVSGSGIYKNLLYKLKASSSNPTLGTGDLDVYVTYVEITL